MINKNNQVNDQQFTDRNLNLQSKIISLIQRMYIRRYYGQTMTKRSFENKFFL